MPLFGHDEANVKQATSRAPRDSKFVRLSLLAILSAAALVQIYAGLELMGLRWDGGPFLQDILSRQGFFSYEPPRLTTQFILELPTLLALRFGVTDLYALAAVWSLSLQLSPLLLTCLCYFVLPADRKFLFVLPVFHYFAGASNVAMTGLLEGPAATAYFWVTLYLLLFAPEQWRARLLVAAVALPTLVLHEIMAIMAPLLAFAAWWRSAQTTDSASRLFLRIFALYFLVVMAVHVGNVIFPTFTRNRDGFVTQLFGLRWLFTREAGINIPAALGLLAGPAILGLWLFPRYATWIVTAFAATAGLVIATAFPTDKFTWPTIQFYARNHPAIISWPLALAAIAASRWSEDAARLAAIRTGHAMAILLILAAGGLVAQAAAIRDWANYVSLYREIVTTRTGLVVWEDLMKELPPERARLLRRMNFDWTNPSMSLLLSPDGKVRTVVTNPKTAGWQHWDPRDPLKWPKGNFYDKSGFPMDTLSKPPPGGTN